MMDTEGEQVSSGTDGGGWRQFLEGRALACASSIDLLLGGAWISGRYEMDNITRRGFFCAGETMMLINHTMKFRWTPREEEMKSD